MKAIHIFIVLLAAILNSCSQSSTQDIQDTSNENDFGWSVPLNEIVGDLNPFPLAENPVMSSVAEIEGLNDDAMVTIISKNSKTNIYPLSFVHPFEVVNDTLSGKHFAMSYCPITQSTVAINRDIINQKFTFRASGILYKENLVMYDNVSNTFWSQMLLKSIKGPFQDEKLSVLPIIETTWKTAKTYFPDARVFSNKSVISSKTEILSKSIENINNNEKVFGLIDNIISKDPIVFIYQYSQFNSGIKLISSGTTSEKIVIGSSELKFITAFLNENNNSFTAIQNEFPLIMVDNLGNKWNVFGEAVSGPDKGKTLKSATGFVASWWAWKSFYNEFVF